MSPLEEFKNLNEIVSERSYTRKVYDLGFGEKRYRFHIAHKHYKDKLITITNTK